MHSLKNAFEQEIKYKAKPCVQATHASRNMVKYLKRMTLHVLNQIRRLFKTSTAFFTSVGFDSLLSLILINTFLVHLLLCNRKNNGKAAIQLNQSSISK